MHLSVFKKIHLPKNKEEKGLLAKYASNPFLPEVVECNDIKQLINTTTTYGYSPSIFKNYRKKSGFLYTDFIILDLDDGLTIPDALIRIQNLNITCVCLTTASHTEYNHRFRLMFPLVKRISNNNDYVCTIEYMHNLFPECDQQCKDESRFYYPSNLTDDGFVYEGELLVPIISLDDQNSTSETLKSKRLVLVSPDIEKTVESIYGANRTTIPQNVDFFIRNAHTGLPGCWNNTINSVCFTLGLNGFTYDDVYGIIQKLAPEELDDRDIFTIERAYNQGFESREESNSVPKRINIW